MFFRKRVLHWVGGKLMPSAILPNSRNGRAIAPSAVWGDHSSKIGVTVRTVWQGG